MTLAFADDSVLPGQGNTAAHYETLWTKSPFSVATPDAVDTSPDYTLVGITQLDGVAYASVVDAHTQDHFVISTEKTIQGLKLVSITHSRSGSDTFASVQKDGQVLSLKLQSAALPPAGGVPGPNGQPPGMMPPITQNIQMPGTGNPPPGVEYGTPGTIPAPRSVRVHRPIIHLPPPPVAPDPNANPQGGGVPQPVQTHNPPPQ
jgi:hypothetical protein